MILVNMTTGAARPQAEGWPDPPGTTAPGDWQFKVVRGWFGTRGAIEALQDEQSEFGWRLVEVLDEFRVRFGRPAAVAAKDVARAGNPFSTRSRVGGRAAFWPLALLRAFAALLAFGLLMVWIRGEVEAPSVATPARLSVPTEVAVPAPAPPMMPLPPAPVEAPRTR